MVVPLRNQAGTARAEDAIEVIGEVGSVLIEAGDGKADAADDGSTSLLA